MGSYAGHIKLPRTLLRHSRDWLWRDPVLWAIYTQMLLEAAWGDSPEHTPPLSRGEVQFSSRYVAERFGIDQSTATRKLTQLVTRELTHLIDKKNGIYRLNCYEKMDDSISSDSLNDSQTDSQSDSKEKKISKEDRKEDTKESKPGYSTEFEEIWLLWTRKSGKDGSFKAYKKLAKSHSHADILRGATHYLANLSEARLCNAFYNWVSRGLAKEAIESSSHGPSKHSEPTARPVHARILDPHQAERARRERLDRQYQDTERGDGTQGQ